MYFPKSCQRSITPVQVRRNCRNSGVDSRLSGRVKHPFVSRASLRIRKPIRRHYTYWPGQLTQLHQASSLAKYKVWNIHPSLHSHMWLKGLTWAVDGSRFAQVIQMAIHIHIFIICCLTQFLLMLLPTVGAGISGKLVFSGVKHRQTHTNTSNTRTAGWDLLLPRPWQKVAPSARHE